MNNAEVKNVAKIISKAFVMTFCFTLKIFLAMLAATSKKKQYEPTFEELTCGEKIPGSDKYFIPEHKHHK